MDFAFSDEQVALRDNVRKLMSRIATPDYVRKLDQQQAYPDELYDAWVEMGLLRLPFDESLGGVGGSALDLVVLADELARTSFDFYTAYSSSIFCGLNIAKMGSQAQKDHWLPKLLSGEIKMSISMSEPDAGSDIGAMRTSAKRDGDGWVINGRKIWATGAGAKRNVINMYVKTDTTADYRKGMSLLLIPNDTPGLQLRKLEMLGRRCTGTFEITLDNVRVPAENLVGGENNGWACVMGGLQIERITSAAGYCGSAQAALDMTVQYAKDRTADVYPAYQLGWFPDYSDADNYLTPFFLKENFLGNHYDNPEVNDLILKQAVEPDAATRTADIEKIQDLVANDLSTVPLLQGAQVAVTGADVSGVTLDASFKLRFAPITK